MSERVMLYTSHPMTFEDLSTAIVAAGGKPDPSAGDEYDILGRIEEGERHILVSGYRKPDMEPSQFWDDTVFHLGQNLALEIEAKLGAKPVTSFYIEIGHGPRSGLLAVELGYQCALRWPCIVWAEVFEAGQWVVKVFTLEDMQRLRSEGKAFTTYGMFDD